MNTFIQFFIIFLCEISPSPAWRRMRALAAGRWRGSPRPPWTLEKRNSTASIECEMDNLVGRRNSVFGDFSLFSRQFLLPFSPIQHVRYQTCYCTWISLLYANTHLHADLSRFMPFFFTSLNTKRVGKNAISFLPPSIPPTCNFCKKNRNLPGRGKYTLQKTTKICVCFSFFRDPLSPTAHAGEGQENLIFRRNLPLLSPLTVPLGQGEIYLRPSSPPLFALNCKVLHHLAFVSRKRKQNL